MPGYEYYEFKFRGSDNDKLTNSKSQGVVV